MEVTIIFNDFKKTTTVYKPTHIVFHVFKFIELQYSNGTSEMLNLEDIFSVKYPTSAVPPNTK